MYSLIYFMNILFYALEKSIQQLPIKKPKNCFLRQFLHENSVQNLPTAWKIGLLPMAPHSFDSEMQIL